MLRDIMTVFANGMGGHEFALTFSRIALGSFFAISGYHKLTNAARHATLCATLKDCGVPCIGFFQWFVPGVEFLGGLAVAVGFVAPLAAVGLVCVCLVATTTDGLKRIRSWQPIDKADWLDDILYLPEVLYIILLAIVVVAGSGRYSLDQFILSYV